jgi:SAM-dependent methyltransferase
MEKRPDTLFWQTGTPVHSCELMPTAADALACPTGTIDLVIDPVTGVISNRSFVPATQTFTGRYEETQAFSDHFSAYARGLAKRLIVDHDLAGKRILEIGCGKGYFLVELCRMAGASGIGIDPSVQPERFGTLSGVDVAFLGERLGDHHHSLDFDFVICRHTLEHIADVSGFLGLVRRVIGQRTDVALYLDVPNATRILREGAFWDVCYEHCHYFTPASLATVMGASGFTITDLRREYDDQFLCATAVLASQEAAADKPPPLASQITRDVSLELARGFQAAAQAQIDAWREWFANHSGQHIVLWGTGSRAVSFLTTLGLGSAVSETVDINPHKAGTFVPGTGHPIVEPHSLAQLRPDHVLIMNPVYAAEISSELAVIGVSPTLWTVGAPPSRALSAP